MKQNIRQMLLVVALPSLTLIGFYTLVSLRQGMSATSAVLKTRSSAVVECLNEISAAGFWLWPTDDSSLPSHRTSADYFNWLITDAPPLRGDEGKMCMRHLKEEVVSQLYGRPLFSEKNMPWIIVKNLPENAPDNFIVMVTANVNPASLRTRLTEEDMSRQIGIAKNHHEHVLREHIYLIRKNGEAVELQKGLSPQAKFTYREIYGNMSFNLTTNLVNGLPVKYLTPTGEVIPTNE